ncbi:MAG: ribonuclease III [Lachnospiraceae bacterium]|nr:ribonuclease III [Lachnospiraceae bacterium]
MEEGLKYSPLSLSFLGDAYMSLIIRRMLLEKGDMAVGKFHKASVKYVSADSQAMIYDLLMEKDILSDEEKDVMHRGRNHAHPSGRGTNFASYSKATGLESLIGYLYISGKTDRADELILIGADYVSGTEKQ